MSHLKSLVRSSRIATRSKLVSPASTRSYSTSRVQRNDDGKRRKSNLDVVEDTFVSWLVQASGQHSIEHEARQTPLTRPSAVRAAPSIRSFPRTDRRRLSTSKTTQSATAAALATRTAEHDERDIGASHLSSSATGRIESHRHGRPLQPSYTHRISEQSEGDRVGDKEEAELEPLPQDETSRFEQHEPQESVSATSDGLHKQESQALSHPKQSAASRRSEWWLEHRPDRETRRKTWWSNKRTDDVEGPSPTKQSPIPNKRLGVSTEHSQHRKRTPTVAHVNTRPNRIGLRKRVASSSSIKEDGLPLDVDMTSEKAYPWPQSVAQAESDWPEVIEDHSSTPQIVDYSAKPVSKDRVVQIQPMQTPTEQAHSRRVQQYPLAPRLVSLVDDEDLEPERPSRKALRPHSSYTGYNRMKLRHLLYRIPGHAPIEQIMNVFARLDKPQVLYLSDHLVRRMFTHLASVEYENSPGYRDRVLALYRQCMKANIHLHLESYTTAMKYAGTGAKEVTSDHVKEAVEIWMEMENNGITADAAVFNVLYKSAVKAGRHALAQTLRDELDARKLRVNRFMRCNLITGAGRRGDAEAVRTEFTELVNSGELVDTAVMNCTIRALLWADDSDGAEGMLETMKILHSEKFKTEPLRAWQHRRMLARYANNEREKVLAQQEELEASFFGGLFTYRDRLQELQKIMPIAPDATTYRLIIGWHALRGGDLDRIRVLVKEMVENDFAQHVSMWHKIFRGFEIHGGVGDVRWADYMLQAVWDDFLEIVSADQGALARRERYSPVRGQAAQLLSSSGADLQGSVPVEQLKLYERPDTPDRGDRPLTFTTELAQSIMKAWWLTGGEHGLDWIWTQIQLHWKSMSDGERETLVQHRLNLMRRFGRDFIVHKHHV